MYTFFLFFFIVVAFLALIEGLSNNPPSFARKKYTNNVIYISDYKKRKNAA